MVLHRATLRAEDVTDRDGYRVTTPLRTLLDVAASTISLEHLGAATLQALERGLVRRGRLREALRLQPASVGDAFALLGFG